MGKSKKVGHLKAIDVFSVLKGVMGEKGAAVLSGYSPMTNCTRNGEDLELTAEIRSRLQAHPEYNLEKQTTFYAGVRDDAEEYTKNRIAAATRIDKVLGHEAPKKIEFGQRSELASALKVVQMLEARRRERLRAAKEVPAEITTTQEEPVNA
jgi:hypothetical protein